MQPAGVLALPARMIGRRSSSSRQANDVRPRDDAKFLSPLNAGEQHEVLHRVLIIPARAGIFEIGEPFDLGRYVGQLVELGGRQNSRNTGGGISVGS